MPEEKKMPNERKPEISRRSFLKLAGATAGLALGLQGAKDALAQPVDQAARDLPAGGPTETKEQQEQRNILKLPVFELNPEGIQALRWEGLPAEETEFASLRFTLLKKDGVIGFAEAEKIFAQDPEDAEVMDSVLKQDGVHEIFDSLGEHQNFFIQFGVTGSKASFSLQVGEFDSEGNFKEVRHFGANEQDVQELTLNEGEDETLVILENADDPSFVILQAKGMNAALGDAVLMGTQKIPERPNAIEIKSVLTTEGTRDLNAIIDGEAYILIPEPTITHETGEYQTALEFDYLGHKIAIIDRDVFPTTANEQGMRFNENHIDMSAYIARLQRIDFIPEEDTTIEFVTPEYFDQNLADKSLRLVQIQEDSANGINAITYYDNRPENGQLTLYVMTNTSSETVQQSVKNKTLSSFVTGSSLEVLWAHKTGFTYRGGEPAGPRVHEIVSLGITDTQMDPVQDFGVTYRGEYQDGTIIWDKWHADNGLPPYEILTPVPTPAAS